MEIVFRVTVIYFFLLAGMRILGKREFGQMSPFELITLLLIPEIVTEALTGEDTSITGGIIGVSTIFVLVYLTTIITHKSKLIEEFVEGSPTVLAKGGRLFEDALNREKVNPDEIYIEMHRAGLERLEEVRWAILENDGKITIVPERKHDTGRQHEKETVP